MTPQATTDQKHQEDLKRLQKLCLMDDDFLTKCFEGDLASTTLVLQIILDKPDLQATDVRTQVFVENLLNRSVRLDILATDGAGRKYNIEIQRADKGAGSRRARYNSSMIDANLLPKGGDFDDLPETYVIFITERDVLGKGQAIYHIERTILETNEPFADGSHIVYVNGAYRGETPLGRLMHDFACTRSAEMYYDVLRDRVRFFKESKEGVVIMSKVMEELRLESFQEGKAEGKKSVVESMLADGSLTLEKIAKLAGWTLDEVKRLQIERNA